MGRETAEQLSLEIKTPPTDSDPLANRIANHLAEHLTELGIEALVNPIETEELHRQVLINHNFDLYVGQFPQLFDFGPDLLYDFLHSSFAAERGWQNPLGVTDIDLDELLERQRKTTGTARLEAVFDLQHRLADLQPFVPVVLPDSLTAVRTDRFTSWQAANPTTPLGLLSLDRADESAETLRLATTDPRITVNRNPIAAEFRQYGTLTGLFYDPLVRFDDDTTVPWLAETLDWSSTPTAVTVQLREDLTWHDGTPITAEDIVFTYRFLGDTTLGEAENPIPTPRYRGRSTLVDEVEPIDERTVSVEFGDITLAAAEKALEIPLLPEHVWTEQAEIATLVGIEVDGETTEALIWNNPEPIGSGPFRFESATEGERLELSVFEDHFLVDNEPTAIPAAFHSGPMFDSLEIEIVASDASAIEFLSAQEGDATVAPLGPDIVPGIEDEPEIDLIASQSHAFYHVGLNLRRDPLGNPNFRRTVARAIDKAAIAEDAFLGYADPIATPFAGTRWLSPDLEWNDEDPARPFYGENGSFDSEAARESLRDAGFQFDEDGQLIHQPQEQ